MVALIKMIPPETIFSMRIAALFKKRNILEKLNNLWKKCFNFKFNITQKLREETSQTKNLLEDFFLNCKLIFNFTYLYFPDF